VRLAINASASDRSEAIDRPNKSDGIKGFKMLIAAA
jgi:hypothetical protein